MEGRTDTYDLLQEAGSNGELNFALEAPKAVIKQSSQGQRPRPESPPERRINEMRTIYKSDSHVGEAVDTLVDYLVGSGYNIEPRNVPYTDTDQTNEDISELKSLIELSDFGERLIEWVRRAVIDGTAFLELVWDAETNEFRPVLLPALKMEIIPDEYGNDAGYVLETEGDGENPEYGLYDVAVLRFHREPGEMWGHSFIERAQENADMLRDMEIDLARFISTKAYPPILWKLGDIANGVRWSEPEIQGWLDEVENIEPDSMLAVGDDVDHDVVGTTSTSQSAGVLNLDSTFNHLQNRVATGLGLPAFLINVSSDVGRNDSVTQMPKFDRRIQKLRVYIQNAVENQIFRSIMGHPDPEAYTEMLPRFEFGEHSSEEERLETDEALKLLNNGVLKIEAFAERVGLDPERDIPDFWFQMDHLEVLEKLAGLGDDIQNPEGGRPSDTEGGTESAGGEAKTRQNPEKSTDTDDSRNKRDVSNE